MLMEEVQDSRSRSRVRATFTEIGPRYGLCNMKKGRHCDRVQHVSYSGSRQMLTELMTSSL